MFLSSSIVYMKLNSTTSWLEDDVVFHSLGGLVTLLHRPYLLLCVFIMQILHVAESVGLFEPIQEYHTELTLVRK